MKNLSVLLLIGFILTSCSVPLYYTEHHVKTTSDKYKDKPVEKLLTDSPDIQIDQIGKNKFRYVEYYPLGVFRYIRVQYIAIDGKISSLIREEVFTSTSELEGKRQAIRYRIEDFR